MFTIPKELAETRQFYPLCKKYAKRDWKADELHQMFLLKLCEIKQSELHEAKEGGYLDWFCFDVIRQIWCNKDRVKCYEKGSTSDLYEFTGNIEVKEEGYIEEAPEYLDNRGALNVIQEDINSNDIYLNFKARVFAYSIGMRIDNGVVSFGGKFRSQRAFTKETGIPNTTAHKAFNDYKQHLRSKLKLS